MKKFRHVLKPCQVCGMDSGARAATSTEPPKFCVICETCGHRTKLYDSLAAATRDWEKVKHGEG